MPYSKSLILVIEDDSRLSRLLRNHFEKAFPSVRVEIAGSASKARVICEKFRPQLIIWDGEPDERGTREEYAQCIPPDQWSRVLPISSDAESQAWAQGNGAKPCIPKPSEALNSWAKQVISVAQPILNPVKPSRK